MTFVDRKGMDDVLEEKGVSSMLFCLINARLFYY
jgi:hypothetical protein